ncbi:acetyl-CoA C-acyltransferase [Suttonella sp. R2A3]|uniref:acetyl-CoA C-acyltransferase n=1 Tax=Suttonella sp. R2A3 TaxID=2908648 RepID=UPI001F1D7769|nr:acetyl-CoA C-acyltransferase [Suttonella sp. R2A3]UJF24336.1 acetyl-CoA C-acyltransferase [Suttonella sp. R2A3]
MSQNVYIVAATRTPVGKAPRGMFKNVRPDDLLVHVIQSVLAQAPSIDPAQISDVITGCAFPEAEQGLNIARYGAQLAGLPDSVPGLTVNRWCASGLNAVQIAADRIRLGEADVMIASGAESMSMVPMMGNKVSLNPSIFDDDHVALAYGMGTTAENVAKEWQVSREDQDAFSVESHRRALQAQEENRFADEISPIEVTYRQPDLASGEVRTVRKTLSVDEGPRSGTTMDVLSGLRPVFDVKGSVTAGNSSQMSDGAGAVLLVSEKVLKELNLTPLARYCTFAVKGVRPAVMGIGPKEAIPAACRQAGIAQNDLQWIELNEAFAAQSVAVMRDLDLDPARVNPNGGAIALGHPLGATGAIRTASLIHGMRQQGQSGYGMVTMCIGSGMGAAGVFEVF